MSWAGGAVHMGLDLDWRAILCDCRLFEALETVQGGNDPDFVTPSGGAGKAFPSNRGWTNIVGEGL
jgi:hypothetical protein